MRKFFPHLFYIFSGLCMLFTGCRSDGESRMNMPPRPPENRIQSSIFPETPSPDAEAVPVAAPAATQIPEGVSLRLKGKEVDFDLLKTVSDPQNRTVIVSATPLTPYQDVAAVLETLHNMGFLVAFKSEK